ncbi:MAG: hypothetical protein P8Y02_01945, partial [Deinococcales bacterium]
MRTRSLLALTLLGALLVGWGQGQAVDSSTKKSLESDIQQAQQQLQARKKEIQDITQKLGDTAQQLQAKIRQRDAVNKELSDLQAQQAKLQDQLSALEKKRAATEAKINDLNTKLDALKQRVKALLLNLYQQRDERYANSQARSRTLHQFQVNSDYLSLLSKQDVDVINQLDSVLAQLKTAQSQLADQMAALKAKQDEIAQ